MLTIKEELLKKYTDAFIMYEIINHGVNPRESLEGTTMRIECNEGYKYRVIRDWNFQREKDPTLSYADAVKTALHSNNLVNHFKKGETGDYEKIFSSNII